jgi:hypothetical protein
MKTDGKRIIYGFLNGAVNVFPLESMQVVCRNNVTSFKSTFEYLFLKRLFDGRDDYVTIVDHTAAMLRYPYGLTFSCFEAMADVFVFKTKLSDAEISRTVKARDEETNALIDKPVYSVDEIFNNRLMLGNNIITNVIFNLGYMYSDVADYSDEEPASLRYWSNVGSYIGDFMIRFFFREDFLTTFNY